MPCFRLFASSISAAKTASPAHKAAPRAMKVEAMDTIVSLVRPPPILTVAVLVDSFRSAIALGFV